MGISLKAAGTWQTVTTDATATLVGTPAAGDRYYIWVAWKPYSITCQISGWTEVTEYTDGSVANGDGVGSVKISVYYKDWASGDGNPTVDFSSSPDVAGYVVNLWQKGADDAWSTPLFATAPWGSSSSQTVSATSGTTAVPSGGVVMACLAFRDDSATMTRSSTAIDVSSGITWNGNHVETVATHLSTTAGNDLSADVGHRFVTTGGTVTLRASATISAAETGAIVWVVQGFTAAPSGAAISTLTDEFASIGAAWSNTAFTASGGAAVATANTTSTLLSVDPYDATDGTLLWQQTDAAYTGSDVYTGGYYDGSAARWGFQIGASGVVQAVANSTLVGSTRTHANGDWYRVRHTTVGTDTIYFEYSADGVNWTALHSVTSLPTRVDRLKVHLEQVHTSGTAATSVRHVNLPLAETLVDDFDAEAGGPPDPAVWSGWVPLSGSGDAYVDSGGAWDGALVVEADAGSLGILGTLAQYTLEGSSIFWQVVDLEMVDPASGVLIGGGDHWAWSFTDPGTGLEFTDAVETPVAFTPGMWFKLRESAGTVYYEYSTNGATWTPYSDYPSSDAPLNNGFTILQSSNDATSVKAVIDNVNVEPEPVGGNAGAFFFMLG